MREKVTIMCGFPFLTAIVLQITVTEAFHKTTFTLYTTPTVNWQTAVTFCTSHGQNLVRVTSQAEQDFLTSLIRQGQPWYQKNPQETWSSLYDPDPSTPGDGYLWALEPHCRPLGNWTGWYLDEPLNGQTNLCVKLTWTTKPGYVWRTASCYTTIQQVICRHDEGICDTYDTLPWSTVTMTESVKVVQLIGLTSEAACRKACTQYTSTDTTGCYAAQWMHALQCNLHIASGPAATTQSSTLGTTFLRNCYAASLNTMSFHIEEQSFNPSCHGDPDTTTTATRTTTRTATTTKEATATAMTTAAATRAAATTTATTTTTTSTTTPNSTTSSTTTPNSTTTSTTTTTTTPNSTTTSTATTTTPNSTTTSTPATAKPATTTSKAEESTTTLRKRETSPPETHASTTTTATEASSVTLPTSTTMEQTAEPTTTTTTTNEGGNGQSIQSTTTSEEKTSSSSTTLDWSTVGSSSVAPKMKAKLCVCHKSTCGWKTWNSSHIEEQKKQLSRLRKTLEIDRKNTTVYKRKYSSAPDQRTSAQTIGYVGVLVLVLVLAVIVAIDLSAVCCDRAQRVQPSKEQAMHMHNDQTCFHPHLLN